MVKYKDFHAFNDFLNHNKAELLGNYFTYYHLIKMVDVLNRGERDLYECYNLVDENGNFAICIWVTGVYYIYSSSWTNEIVDELSKKIELTRFNDFHFIGQRDIIIALFERSIIDYQVVKDRLVYECLIVNPLKKEVSGAAENATLCDFDTLAKMNQASHAEEYGEGERSWTDFEAMTHQGIEKSHLFVWKDDDKICSIATVISEDRNKPVIGSFYTWPDERNKGYGYALLYAMTEGLLNSGFEKCGLFSDATNPASNKVFTDVGYNPIYKWIDIFKEKKTDL
jgi:RimJ/RimL family protein N-acetyltransferase